MKRLSRMGTCACVASIVVLIAFSSHARAQTIQREGLRNNTPKVHALINARIVPSPGKLIDRGTIVFRDGIIVALGPTAPIPDDARITDVKGKTVYPGLIDSYSAYGLPKPASSDRQPGDQPAAPAVVPRGPTYWNDCVLAQETARDQFLPDAKSAEVMRNQGITTALVVPTRGLFKGSSALVNLGSDIPGTMIVKAVVGQHVLLGVPEGGGEYPGSLMGAIALIRQVFYDASWYRQAHDAYRSNPALQRPESNSALAAMDEGLSKKLPFVFETNDEFDILRADKIAREFSLNILLRGNGNEFKRIDAVKQTGRPLILPVNFPDPPAVQSPEDAMQVTLVRLRYWDEAPENPARLHSAGIEFVLCSATLKEPSTFIARVRKAVRRGLPADAALAALTTTPAKLFGVEKELGALEIGKKANLLIADGDLFAEKTVVREVWIDGIRYAAKEIPENDPRGTWETRIDGVTIGDTLRVILKGEPESLQGSFVRKKEAKFSTASFNALRLALAFPGDSIGFSGVVRMTALVRPDSMDGTGEWSDGRTFLWHAVRTRPFFPEPDTTRKEGVTASFAPVFPYGEFGRPALPEQPAVLLVKGATVWTSGPQGRLENADILVEKGKITSVGKALKAPDRTLIIDGTGKHITPGIIDAHSHTAAAGSVNEAGQAISAEVRIEDVLDCEDIGIYRELAGGTTTIHVLHGSANPIGGQNAVIKLRWGRLPDELRFDGAAPTIKFALGENVKQSNWGDRYTTRYPQTRMGVEQIMRDEFMAARDYERSWQRWEKEKKGIPPRRNLELDAILEILQGKRFVHCHSYRQDEILAMMRVAEEFGFRVRTFQHVLEGYKVADVMAKHGAGGSSFSDWWAYKLEVYDAIPYNGVLMHDQGVVVSYNSDSDELARHLNLEAAKAVKYGGLTEEEALKFVTINPAKQLFIDKRVGTLEPGKDADFAIWNGNPLSTYTMCEQTWVDGRKYFDRSEDSLLYAAAQRERAVLIQKALTAGKSGGSGDDAKRTPKHRDDVDHPRCLESMEEGRP